MLFVPERVAVLACVVAFGSSAPLRAESGVLWEAQTLLASDRAAGDEFGAALAIEGDTLVVGAYRDDIQTGAVYVFERTASGWVERQKLLASDAAPGSNFGESVALEGTTLVVGASLADGAQSDTGAAYVFVRGGTGWVEQAKLTASDGTTGDRFGLVALSGTTVVVAAPSDDPVGMSSGSAYVFERTGTTWSEQARLVASDASMFGFFGVPSVAGDTIVVQAPNVATAYVFERSGTSWSEVARLPQPTSGGGTLLAPDLLAIGAPDDDDLGNDAGAVLFHAPVGGSWTLLSKAYAADPESSGRFGLCVQVGPDFATVLDFPTVTVHARTGSSWVEEFELRSTVGTFEFSTQASSGGTVVVGDPTLPPTEALWGAGCVFVYELIDTSTFCDVTDGSLAACPCGPGFAESGCATAQALGGVELHVLGQDDAARRATLQGVGFPTSAIPTAIAVRAGALDPGTPVAFGDGLRCVGTPLVRLAAAPAFQGVSTHRIGHGVASGTWFYQLWFRNEPAVFCSPAAFNLSNGRKLTW